MRGSMIRHKSRVKRIVHQHFYPPATTMVIFPLLPFHKGMKGAKELRSKLAAILRELRAKYPNLTKMVDKGQYRKTA